MCLEILSSDFQFVVLACWPAGLLISIKANWARVQGFILQTLTLPPSLAGAAAYPRGTAAATAAEVAGAACREQGQGHCCRGSRSCGRGKGTRSGSSYCWSVLVGGRCSFSDWIGTIISQMHAFTGLDAEKLVAISLERFITACMDDSPKTEAMTLFSTLFGGVLSALSTKTLISASRIAVRLLFKALPAHIVFCSRINIQTSEVKNTPEASTTLPVILS